MLPSLDNLRCFVFAARLLNFRRAARAVALTPTAFGQRIKQLEEQVGARLFTRTTRSMHMTEAGRALLVPAEQCLGFAEQSVRAARGEAAPPAVDLVLGTRHELGMSWILPEIDALSKERPWLRLHLYFGSGPDLLTRVRSMEIDCAVTSSRLNDPKLDSIRLHREDYILCGSASLLRRKPFRRPEHAERHTLIDASAERPLFRYWADAPAGGDRLRFASEAWMGSIDAIRKRVGAGAGVAVLPEYLIRRDLRTGRFRRILPSVKLLHDYFRLIFRTDDPRRSVLEGLADSLLRIPLQ